LTSNGQADTSLYERLPNHPLGPDGLDPEWVEQVIIFTTAGLQGRINRKHATPRRKYGGPGSWRNKLRRIQGADV
jgi:hypothetical protein